MLYNVIVKADQVLRAEGNQLPADKSSFKYHSLDTSKLDTRISIEKYMAGVEELPPPNDEKSKQVTNTRADIYKQSV